jgi:hypothetical protein
MKTLINKRIIRNTLGLFAVFAILLSGCKKNDDSPAVVPTPTPVSSSLLNPGDVIPADHFPSLRAPLNITSSPLIGDPVLAEMVSYNGDFSPSVRQYLGTDMHGTVKRKAQGVLCSDITRSWNAGDGPYWSYGFPTQHVYFDAGGLCTDNNTQIYSNEDGGTIFMWDYNSPRRYNLRESGGWKEGEFLFSKTKSEDGYTHEFKSYWKQVLGHPDLYLSLYRDWVVTDDFTRSGEGTFSVEITKITGVEETDVSTFSSTLSLGVTAEYGPVSATVNSTFNWSSSNSVTFYQQTTETTSNDYAIPAGETWRFITFHGVERYSFTDSDGNDWESPNLELAGELGVLEDYVSEYVMIVRYN